MRRPIPGDTGKRRWGLQEERQNYNRIYVGQVVDVDEANGVLTVTTTGGVRDRCVLPLGGLSHQGAQSAWIRFMPEVGDHVLVAFGTDGQMFCLGMTAWGDSPELEPGHRVGGYAQIAEIAQRDSPPAGVREFIELKPGEYDLRSSGGAYVHGSRGGVLTLSGGGLTRLAIDARRSEAALRAGMFEYAEAGVKLRAGDIKRPAAGKAKDQPPLVGGKAWELDVGSEAAAGVVTKYYEGRIGDVRDTVGVVVTGPVGPTRLSDTVYGTGNASVYTYKVDGSGNVDMTCQTRWTTTAATLRLRGNTSATIDGGAVYVGTEGRAVDPMLLSSKYRPAEDTMCTALNAADQSEIGIWTALAGTATAAASSVGTAPQNAAAIAALSSAMASALTGYMTSVLPARIAARNAFTGAASTYLSVKAFTE